MTRGVRFHHFGGPEVLRIEELPAPEPGSGEVRLRMHAVGLNPADSMLYRGISRRRTELPSPLGCEGAGTVEAIGTDVDPAWLGRKVSLLPTNRAGHYGTLGEQVLAPLAALVENPDGFSDSECSAIWLNYLTAYTGLIEAAHVKQGDCVLVTAATTSLGIAAIQIAKAERATTIAVTRDGRWKRELLSIGADHVASIDEEDAAAEIRRITHGQNARIVFSPVGEPFLGTAILHLKESGIFLTSDELSDVRVASNSGGTVPKGIRVCNSNAAQITDQPEKLAVATVYIRDRLKFGFLQVEVARKFPFEQVVDAYRHLESNEAFGKIVVTFPEQTAHIS